MSISKHIIRISFASLLWANMNSTVAQTVPQVKDRWWMTNGTVDDIAVDETAQVAYLAGGFTEMQPPIPRPYGVIMDKVEGWPDLDCAVPNNAVRAVVGDGNGGWFIGGDFTMVGAVSRSHLAHLLPNGTVDPNWTSGTDQLIRTLALFNGVLYAGGDFSSAGGLPRFRLAAFNALTGAVTGWNSGFLSNNNSVYAICVGTDAVYVGGTFTSLGGAARTRIGAVGLTDGAATTWAPTISAPPKVLAYNAGRVFVGGYYFNVNGTNQAHIAAINAVDATLLSGFAGTTNSEVTSLAIAGDTLFVGGGFSTFMGQPRKAIAAVDLGDLTILNWAPMVETGGGAAGLCADNDAVYVAGYGGNITTSNGASFRYGGAAFDRSTGMGLDWDPHYRGFGNNGPYATCLGLQDQTVYFGGWYSQSGIRPRQGLSAIDLQTGLPTHWDPKANTAGAYAVELYEDIAFIGGGFTQVAGQPRPSIAAVDRNLGAPTSWFASMSGGFPRVNDLVITGDTLFVAGAFTAASGLPREGLAAINTVTGQVLDWDHSTDGFVNALGLHNGRLYCGGEFTQLGGVAHQGCGRVDLASDLVDDWNPDLGTIDAFEFRGDTVFVGGNVYGDLGNEFVSGAAAIDEASAALIPWGGTAIVGSGELIHAFALELSNGWLYAGGYGIDDHLIAMSSFTGDLQPWAAGFSEQVNTLKRTGQLLLAGGGFNQVQGQSRVGFVALEIGLGEEVNTGLNPVASTGTDPIIICPNPTTQSITIKGGTGAQITLRLTDALGRTLRIWREPDTSIFGLDGLTVGTYVVELVRNGEVIHRATLIKQ